MGRKINNDHHQYIPVSFQLKISSSKLHEDCWQLYPNLFLTDKLGHCETLCFSPSKMEGLAWSLEQSLSMLAMKRKILQLVCFQSLRFLIAFCFEFVCSVMQEVDDLLRQGAIMSREESKLWWSPMIDSRQGPENPWWWPEDERSQQLVWIPILFKPLRSMSLLCLDEEYSVRHAPLALSAVLRLCWGVSLLRCWGL